MRQQILLGFLFPVVLFAVGSIGAWHWKGGEHEGTQAPPALSEAEQRAEDQRLRRPVLERLKDEDVKVEILPMPVIYPDVETLVQRVDSIVLGTIVESEPYVRIDEFNEPQVYTDYLVTVEDDFGNPLNECETGQRVIIRAPGGSAKITGHFLDMTIRHWPILHPGDKAIFFVKRGRSGEPNSVYLPGLFPFKDADLQMESQVSSVIPSVIGKSTKEFMAEIRAAAPLLRKKSQK
jgi:hypothetical protein